MARCSWMICIGLIFLFSSAAAVASESLSNGTRTNVTAAAERDGRAYDVHPPDSTNNQRVEVVQSLSPRPKSLGTGTWKAIKIWNDPVEATSSSTAKRASSPERVVASSSSASRPGDSSILITFLFLPAFMLFVTRLIEELSISPK
ncbi:uncharacterized protein LOC124203074 [Daphnia pulex]|uniref:uncharacterized protein LOC124203074 n=1 Tax=Daphnia pulex TaxID=6669 RepID=UPI001EDE8549|nr:uncharacterized protein LOC124203074 [Daphnia pulex]XP_046655752.1 uncharacterized protein LOC124349310 [Daphnia pulicaria]